MHQCVDKVRIGEGHGVDVNEVKVRCQLMLFLEGFSFQSLDDFQSSGCLTCTRHT